MKNDFSLEYDEIMKNDFSLEYEFIHFLLLQGISMKKVWTIVNPPISYDSFRKAVKLYSSTGKKRAFRVVREDLRPDPSRGTNYSKKLISNGITPSMIVMDDIMEHSRELANINAISMEQAAASVSESFMSQEETCDALTKYDIIELLKKGCRSQEIHGDPIVASDIIDDLKEEGYCINYADGIYKLSTNIEKKQNHVVKDWNGRKHIRIGVVSDTHIGNRNCQMSFLNHAYDIFEEFGITQVLHCGDISDGWYPNRSDQIYELFAHGADQQVDYIVENYPKREGITTDFIIGNHDWTFVRNTGYNIGPAIAMRRPDMNYLGVNNARVWITPNCDIEMNHPGDGSAYAMSYSIQKYIDSMSGGDKPKILLNGHHHKYLAMFYRNVHAIEVPCTEAQTMFMKGKRLAAHMGAIILDIYVDDEGTIDRLAVELIPLYKSLDNDY